MEMVWRYCALLDAQDELDRHRQMERARRHLAPVATMSGGRALIRSVACPKCGAHPGDMCITASGGRSPVSHSIRSA